MVFGEPSIDEFEFIKPLTSGGFGKVYLAKRKLQPARKHSSQDEKIYAVKVVYKKRNGFQNDQYKCKFNLIQRLT